MVKVSKCVINRYYKSPSQRTYCLAVKYDSRYIIIFMESAFDEEILVNVTQNLPWF